MDQWRHRVALALAVAMLPMVWFWLALGPKLAALWLVGGALGFSLHHAGFSFAGGFRLFITHRRGALLRAQLVMLALATILVLPAVASGSLFGAPARGLVFPVGLAALLGAFLFGVGMQLGGGCGSGTLYGAGAGNARLGLTLMFFIAGATLAAWRTDLWAAWPSLPATSLLGHFGLWPTLFTSLALIVLAYGAVRGLERRRHGHAVALSWRADSWHWGILWRGPWPLLWGALALAVLNLATLWLAGRPWAITAAFPLWGSRAIEALGWDDPAFWPYWEDPTRAEALLRPVLSDRTTIMDIGMLAGAAGAAILAGRAARSWRLRSGEVAASIIGGLLLGIGAILGSGCNISAWVSGTASGSLHGWVWILPALLGNAVGIALRPRFRLDTPSRHGSPS